MRGFKLAYVCAAGLMLCACGDDRDGDDGGPGIGPGDGDPGGTGGDDGGDRYDVAEGGGGGCEEGGDCPECNAPDHTPCDSSTDPVNAMGLGCPGDPEVMATTNGSPAAIGVRSKFGPTSEWDPREGEKYAVIASGLLAELDSETPDADANDLLGGHTNPTYCNDDLDTDIINPQYDPLDTLPAPLQRNDVDPSGVDCVDNPALVGTGDCSNTIQGQFDQGMMAYDYTEIRFTASVPDEVNSFSYDFAYFTTEYPYYSGMPFNDMYIGWLESLDWTGNVSFDEMGNPISLNAGFLDFRDDTGALPEFSGTCMRYHAGTKWLSTTAGVTPGETITVVFAVFDLADSILDSYVFLDNFLWGCDGDKKPNTKPVG